MTNDHCIYFGITLISKRLISILYILLLIRNLDIINEAT